MDSTRSRAKMQLWDLKFLLLGPEGICSRALQWCSRERPEFWAAPWGWRIILLWWWQSGWVLFSWWQFAHQKQFLISAIHVTPGHTTLQTTWSVLREKERKCISGSAALHLELSGTTWCPVDPESREKQFLGSVVWSLLVWLWGTNKTIIIPSSEFRVSTNIHRDTPGFKKGLKRPAPLWLVRGLNWSLGQWEKLLDGA